MLYARSKTGEILEAAPHLEGYCPACGNCVIAKCGDVKVWHWSHTANRDCDPWHESESQWHIDWKQSAPRCEVVIGPHRADIVTRNGTVVELQHSYLSVAEIQEREAFYRQMIWIFDCRLPYQGERIVLTERDNFYVFRWLYPRQTIASCTKRVYLDLGDFLLEVRSRGGNFRAGWGYLRDPNMFRYEILWNF